MLYFCHTLPLYLSGWPQLLSIAFITLTDTSLTGNWVFMKNLLCQFTYHTVTILVNGDTSTAMHLAWEGRKHAIHGSTHSPCFNNTHNLRSVSVAGIQIEALFKRSWCFWKCRGLPLESNGITGTKRLTFRDFSAWWCWCCAVCNLWLYLCSLKRQVLNICLSLCLQHYLSCHLR